LTVILDGFNIGRADKVRDGEVRIWAASCAAQPVRRAGQGFASAAAAVSCRTKASGGRLVAAGSLQALRAAPTLLCGAYAVTGCQKRGVLGGP
jgi:hypothetical protein